jgi:WD40 repeat protein
MRINLILLCFAGVVFAEETPKTSTGYPLPEPAMLRLGSTAFRTDTEATDGTLLYSADGRRLVGLNHQAVYVWDADNGKLLRRIARPMSEIAKRVILSPDGKLLAADSDRKAVQFWNLDTGETVAQLIDEDGVRPPVPGFLADGTPVYLHTKDTEVLLLEARSKKELHRFKHRTPGNFFVEIVPDGKSFLVVNCDGRSAKIQEVQQFDQAFKLQRSIRGELVGREGQVRCSPDGSTLLLESENEVSFWSLEGKRLTEQPLSNIRVPNICFTQDGKRAIIGDFGNNFFGLKRCSVELLDVTNNKRILTVENISVNDGRVAFRPDGKRFAFWGDRRVLLWDAETGKPLQPPVNTHREAPSWVEFSPDGKQLAVAAGGEVCLWSIPDGRLLNRLQVQTESTTLEPLRFSPDGRYLTLNNNDFQVWEIASGNRVATIPESVHSLHIVENGTQIYLTQNQRIKHREFPSLKLIRDLKIETPISPEIRVFPELNRLVVRDYGSLKFYELKTSKLLHSFSPEPENTRYQSLWVSPYSDWVSTLQINGHWRSYHLLTGKTSKTECAPLNWLTDKLSVGRRHLYAYTIWDGDSDSYWHCGFIDPRTGTKLRHEIAMDRSIGCMTLSPHGRYLATGCPDTTVLVWDLWAMQAAASPLRRESNLNELWNQLDGEADLFPQLASQFLARPTESLKLLEGKLMPATPLSPQEITRALDSLYSRRFSAREKAQRTLEQFGPQAIPSIRNAFETASEEDIRNRLQQILDRSDSPHQSGDRLRLLRSIEILERLNSPESRTLLQKLSQGDPEALQTRAARSA